MPSPPAPWVEPSEIDLRLAAKGISGVDTVRAAQAATDYLYERSGRRFNVETWIVRPQRVSSSCGCPTPATDQYQRSWCGCSSREVVLVPHPVDRIVEVLVDGVALVAADYQLYDSRVLVRLDGSSWPCCQMLHRPVTEAGTWQVTFRAGDTVPDLGWLAASELAYQIGLQLGGSDDCQLPERAVSVNRQGIQITLSDVTYLQERMFGIPTIDAFLDAFGRGPAPSFVGPDDPHLRSRG